MVNVLLAGRTDLEDYFRISGVFTSTQLNHTPFLVFLTTESTVEIRIVYKAKDLLALPDETPVMGQWRGEWRSDYFQFTVGQYREFINKA